MAEREQSWQERRDQHDVEHQELFFADKVYNKVVE